MRKVTFGALATLIAFGQVSAAFADRVSGMDSNRTALNLPTSTRIDQCVQGANCDTPDASAHPFGSPPIVVPLLLAGIVGGGIAIAVAKNHPHYTPVSP